jgi:hypothetical protein
MDKPNLPSSKLDENRTNITEWLRHYQQWGLAILRARKEELERSISESGGALPVTGAEEETFLWYTSSDN